MRRYNEQKPIVSPFLKSSLYSFNRSRRIKNANSDSRQTILIGILIHPTKKELAFFTKSVDRM